MSPAHLLLSAHIAAGAVAVPLGALALATRKGGRAHLRFGAFYYQAMTLVIGSAAVLSAVHREPYLAGLTAAAAIGTFSGRRVLGRKRPDREPAQRAALVDWALALAALAVGLALLAMAATGVEMRSPPVIYSLAGTSVVYGLYDLARFFRPGAWPFSPRLWLYEHIVKITGAYFGAVAAFSGNLVLPLPEPWRQLWAPALGEALIVFFLLRYRRAARAASPAAPTGP
jgi:hypothetical protein